MSLEEEGERSDGAEGSRQQVNGGCNNVYLPPPSAVGRVEQLPARWEACRPEGQTKPVGNGCDHKMVLQMICWLEATHRQLCLYIKLFCTFTHIKLTGRDLSRILYFTPFNGNNCKSQMNFVIFFPKYCIYFAQSCPGNAARESEEVRWPSFPTFLSQSDVQCESCEFLQLFFPLS